MLPRAANNTTLRIISAAIRAPTWSVARSSVRPAFTTVHGRYRRYSSEPILQAPLSQKQDHEERNTISDAGALTSEVTSEVVLSPKSRILEAAAAKVTSRREDTTTAVGTKLENKEDEGEKNNDGDDSGHISSWEDAIMEQMDEIGEVISDFLPDP